MRTTPAAWPFAGRAVHHLFDRIERVEKPVILVVHAVVPAAELDTAVETLAASLVELPAEAVGLAKLTIDLCDAVERGSGRDIERIANSLLLPSPEYKQRVEAFKARRRGE
jgi:enoyl-CoA hydratase/carnithine racemase